MNEEDFRSIAYDLILKTIQSCYNVDFGNYQVARFNYYLENKNSACYEFEKNLNNIWKNDKLTGYAKKKIIEKLNNNYKKQNKIPIKVMKSLLLLSPDDSNLIEEIIEEIINDASSDNKSLLKPTVSETAIMKYPALSDNNKECQQNVEIKDIASESTDSDVSPEIPYTPEKNISFSDEEISPEEENYIFGNTEDTYENKNTEKREYDIPFDVYAMDLMMQLQNTDEVSIGKLHSYDELKNCIAGLMEQVNNADRLIDFIKDYPDFNEKYSFSINIKNFRDTVKQNCMEITESEEAISMYDDYSKHLADILTDAINTYILENIVINMLCDENNNDYREIFRKIIEFLEILGLYTKDKPAENELYDFDKFHSYYDNTPILVDNPDMHGIVFKVDMPAFFLSYYDMKDQLKQNCIRGKVNVYRCIC